MATSIILSFTFLLIGTGLRYLIGRRRFVRRNYAGLETFRSYTRFLLITCLERGGMFIGRLLELAGLILLLIALYGRYG